MPLIYFPDLRLNATLEGPADAPPLVLIHGLGTSLHLWNAVAALLPQYRVLKLDLRGHGQSDVPAAPYKMGTLINDVERVIDHFGLQDCVVAGVSLGGMIAQGLAIKRFDLVRGLVLSNTAARIGTIAQWQDRIAQVRVSGLQALHDPTMERWLGRNWQSNPALPALSEGFQKTSPEGWMGCAAAISGTDFYEQTATLRLPTLVIAGANDGSTPPDLVRETAGLVPGSDFRLMQGAGHLPMAEKPAEFAALLRSFLISTGHL